MLSGSSDKACISCDFIGCNFCNAKSHARDHFLNSKHNLFIDIELNYLYCYSCDGYVLNDNSSGDIARIKEYLELLKSAGSNNKKIKVTRSGQSSLRRNSNKYDMHNRRNAEDLLTKSIWHRRLNLLQKTLNLWRNNCRLKQDCVT
ncbi:hypothetical protein GJ496_003679 [Pomphorhynchus laevis]|nr:hypothetical protein GJ496_003679 [Pomphorhynchus laevis]